MLVGIDVGINGAIALYDHKTGFLEIHDMPVEKRNKTSRVNNYILKDILTGENIDHAFIEQVNAFGMGATGAYNFGWNCACIEAVLSCVGLPYTYVTPQKWKKAMQCPKDKDAARVRASQLLPAHTDKWKLKKHDGRAESALIALYGVDRFA